MKSILYLLPNTLGLTCTDDLLTLQHTIPVEVQRIIAQLDYFIAENAKSARALLKLVSLSTPLSRPLQEIIICELNVNTPKNSLATLLAPMLQGKNGGLLSEAGLPAIADPGADLVMCAHQHGLSVRPLVGPSSLMLALMASGLNGQSFAFNGYLPTDDNLRSKRIAELEQRSRREMQTQIFIETPYRNIVLLNAFIAHCTSATMLCIAFDLTLPTESISTLSISTWKKQLAQNQLPLFHKKPAVFLFLAN